ncbi:MAG: hypothetical protein JJ902_21170 [Roseibium sp.]|nr:hypothetical protein [Roseibium sp.]
MAMQTTRILKTAGVIALLVGLGACRELEENRPIKLDKGNYDGPADQALSEETQRELRARGTLQGF